MMGSMSGIVLGALTSGVFVATLCAAPAAAQVRVETRLEKPTYFAGEPIFLIADVTNLFAEPIAYDASGGFEPDVTLDLRFLERSRPFADRIASCPLPRVSGGGGGWGVDPGSRLTLYTPPQSTALPRRCRSGRCPRRRASAPA